MPYADVYLHSPLSSKIVKEKRNKALLLQFILAEIFNLLDADKKEDPLKFVFSSPTSFFPYDWFYEVGALNKVKEHAALLPFAFPSLKGAIKSFNRCLDRTMLQVIANKKSSTTLLTEQLLVSLELLYHHLSPFLIACKESEDLLLFLFKHANEIAQVSRTETLETLLRTMFPEGFEAISHLIRGEYQNRGFKALLPEIDRMLSIYEK